MQVKPKYDAVFTVGRFGHTCPDSGKGCEELTKQQLFAQNLLDVFLTFHREALHQTTASDPQVIQQTLVSDL